MAKGTNKSCPKLAVSLRTHLVQAMVFSGLSEMMIHCEGRSRVMPWGPLNSIVRLINHYLGPLVATQLLLSLKYSKASLINTLDYVEHFFVHFSKAMHAVHDFKYFTE